MGKLRADLARDFSVSSAIIFYRLESLKYEISQYLNGVSLDEIELLSDNLQKQKGINARSLNNFKRN